MAEPAAVPRTFSLSISPQTPASSQYLQSRFLAIGTAMGMWTRPITLHGAKIRSGTAETRAGTIPGGRISESLAPEMDHPWAAARFLSRRASFLRRLEWPPSRHGGV